MPVPRLREIPWHALRMDVAAPAIARVLSGAAAEREVDRTLRAHRGLSREERRAAVEAIFGVALWRRRLAWGAGISLPSNLGAPGPRPTAIIPNRSDIPAILVTYLLRDLAGLSAATAAALTGITPAPPRGEPDMLADRWSLPDWLAAHLERELGPDAEAFCSAIAVPGPVCLRANRLLCTRDGLVARLDGEGIATRPGALSPDALIVESPSANLFGSQAWRDGWFEPQDEGSQAVGSLVDPRPGETVLDLCAGAGGKSLLLAAQGASVLAHDTDQERLARLQTRAARAHATRIEIVRAPAAADHVLVDAPCSELGTLRRGPDARWRIDPESLDTLPRLQSELLDTAARCANKRLVYVTCTLNRAENESVAARFDERHPAFHRVRELKLYPHVHGTDGFYAAVWERRT